ncbi:MAG: TetR/AcrR family transcriptional regulator [Phycisphaerales bacterium]
MPPKFARRPSERPDEILAAALEVFLEEGFATAKMEAVGSRAGITAGTIYRYFPSKQALVEALLDRHLDPSWSRGRDLAEAYGSRTAREIVHFLLIRWAGHLRGPEAGGLLRLLVREAPTFPDLLAKYSEQLLHVGTLAVGRALRHGIERGEFHLLEVDTAARAMTGAILGMAVAEATFRAAYPTAPGTALDPMDELVETLVRGLPVAPSVSTGPAPAISTNPAPLRTEPAGSGRLTITTLRPPEPS